MGCNFLPTRITYNQEAFDLSAYHERRNTMSEHKKPESKPDDLTKTTAPNSIELTEADLKRVSGGGATGGSGGGKAGKPQQINDNTEV
jgi:hypothetical protein